MKRINRIRQSINKAAVNRDTVSIFILKNIY